MGLGGLEQLHPFDVRKFGRAWELLRKRFGAQLDEWHLETDREVSRKELLTVHSAESLDTLGTSSVASWAEFGSSPPLILASDPPSLIVFRRTRCVSDSGQRQLRLWRDWKPSG